MLKLAGEALAHAAWSIEDGEMLVPLAMVSRSGTVELVRFDFGRHELGVEEGRRYLRELLGDGECAALVCDTFATSDDGIRSDALMVEIIGPRGAPIGQIIQRYRPAARVIPVIGPKRGFAVTAAAFVSDGFTVADPEREVYAGIREHPEGPRLFARFLP